MRHYLTDSGAALQVLVNDSPDLQSEDIPTRLRRALGVVSAENVDALPFMAGDTTAGVENELQTVVIGEKEDVDLPLTLMQSSYYRNLEKKAAAGDTPVRRLQELNVYITNNPDRLWENSWVRFPRALLNPLAEQMLEEDLLADKRQPAGPRRSDCERFQCHLEGENFLRVPVSYLLKLSLADAIGADNLPRSLRDGGQRLLRHFLNDNTSPETYSFFPVTLAADNAKGARVARETLKRFLLSSLLTQYANEKFQLRVRGQHTQVYFAPNPPQRQRQLNELISDAYYRELFMSPCLSGWDRGEDKHAYMALCHRVLSRSQLNAIARLKEAGIIVSNLVVLPNTSSTSLANNGTHLSLGSRRLTDLMASRSAEFTAVEEKHLGDLVTKIVEHFLPLFVGTYSAAPYRLDFQDFHPERALGFLPHELHDIHLRMIWRRWKKKADLKVMGQPLTPFGPEWLDRLVSRLLGLKGDFLHDFRLIDYLVAVMGTEESPALDGRPGSDLRLKKDLAAMGIFHTAMPLYLLHRLRPFSSYGFTGFEGRYYSQFADVQHDLGQAANLQMLVTALAYRYALLGAFTHGDIPDQPVVESERRQIFFGAAIGIPTFFVHKQSANRFLRKVLALTRGTRSSRRYPEYLRVPNDAYRNALVTLLRRDAADLIEAMGLEDTLADLAGRLDDGEHRSAAARLTRGILDSAGARHPMQLGAGEFNTAAEKYYRTVLHRQHLTAGAEILREDLARLDSWASWRAGTFNAELLYCLGGDNAVKYLAAAHSDLVAERLPLDKLQRLICLTLLSFEDDRRREAENA